VLRDALFSGRGSADLLLPRRPLSRVAARTPARWLQPHRCATLHNTARAQDCGARHGWQVDGERFDAVVLACSATEAARLTQTLAPGWSAQAASLRYEPIVTVYLRWPGVRLPAPMMALQEGADAPAQFAFDHGALGATPGVIAMVVSGAAPWVERGLPATGQAALRQAVAAFSGCRRQRRTPGAAGSGRAPSHLLLHAFAEPATGHRGARRWWPQATTSPGPTRPRWKVPCALAKPPSRCCKADVPVAAPRNTLGCPLASTS
jgi:hypothetical protein